MIDDAAFRKLALVLPEAEEEDHRGHPSFRVRGRIFATLWPGECRAVLKLKVADLAEVAAAKPRTFSRNGWSKQGWINLHLDHVAPAECRALLEEAWRNVAPKKIVGQFDAEKST